MATFAGQSAARRSVLTDMGIDVWVARRAPAIPTEPASEAINETAAAAAPPEAARAAAPEPVAPTTAPKSHAEPAQIESEPRPNPGQLEPVRAADSVPADIVAVCLAADEVVMLVDHCPADQRRLMLDVFAAAAGHKGGAKAKELVFSFNGDEAAQERAFAAFVDKQLADHDPPLMLCSERLCNHLPDRSKARPVIVLPPLLELGNRVALKRELWQQIQSHQT